MKYTGRLIEFVPVFSD